MFRGHSSTLLRDIPGTFVWFGVYEAACMGMTPTGGSRDSLGPVAHMLAGATAGVTAWTVVFPADVVKSRVQTDPVFAGQNVFKVRECLIICAAMLMEDRLQVLPKVLKAEGVRGLYAGWTVTVMRAAPSNAAVFVVFESLMKMMD